MYLFDSKINNNNNNNEKKTHNKKIFTDISCIQYIKPWLYSLSMGFILLKMMLLKMHIHTHLDVGIHLFDGLPSISYERSQETVCIIVNNDNENEKRS